MLQKLANNKSLIPKLVKNNITSMNILDVRYKKNNRTIPPSGGSIPT
jgi:hypothetical protein